MTEKIIETIDFSRKIEEIKKEFGERYYMKDEAIKRAAELWGAPSNDCGVFLDLTEETLVDIKYFKAEIIFCHTSKDYWLVGLNYATPMGGMGYAPSVRDKIGFTSYHDARLAVIQVMQDYFNRAVKDLSQAQQTKVRKIINQLEAEKAPQLSLF